MSTPMMYRMEKSDKDITAMMNADNRQPAEQGKPGERRPPPVGSRKLPTRHHVQQWARVHQRREGYGKICRYADGATNGRRSPICQSACPNSVRGPEKPGSPPG